jgi:hypothetical protein
MIEQTYSRYIGDHADAIARVALLDTTPSADPALSAASTTYIAAKAAAVT